jgi:hypothetical protein
MPFKICSNCRRRWTDRDEFLSDPDVRLLGYQVNFEELQAGLFLFSHDMDGCRTTVALEAERFTDMHRGPIFEIRLTNTAECPGYCLRKESLDACGNACECAYVREVLQKVKNWPKREGRQA